MMKLHIIPKQHGKKHFAVIDTEDMDLIKLNLSLITIKVLGSRRDLADDQEVSLEELIKAYLTLETAEELRDRLNIILNKQGDNYAN